MHPATANPGKQLDIEVDGVTFRRHPVRTAPVTGDSDLDQVVVDHLRAFLDELDAGSLGTLRRRPWQLFVSEKIVAISQGRSWPLADIHPRWWARTLSGRVTRTPHGIGLGCPETMELAIAEVGLCRILAAAVLGGAARMLGWRGLFYRLAGSDVRAIDGPTPGSLYPSNVSAKLPPREPHRVAARLTEAVRRHLPGEFTATYEGCVVIDANDLGRNILGKDVADPDRLLERVFADNPLGQGRQQTPLAVVVRGEAPGPDADRAGRTLHLAA
jgi:asparagine synthase (glutamine-hydrolysing)